MNTFKVLVADDHELILNSIYTILINKLRMKSENIDAFTSSEYALRAIANTDYDIYILDL